METSLRRPLIVVVACALLDPEGVITPPAGYAGKVLYEGELGLVIGQRCKDVDEAGAADAIFGLTVVNDVTALDLLNADYTYVNERVARHYGIPNVYGARFRRVKVTEEERRGLLGHASILSVTSHATRTSPVVRGKWILSNLLGTPPPPPPPDVPALKENSEGSKVSSVRERMELHRANPTCATCHNIMDPLGFALENFDATGRWQIGRAHV
jgi:hypothetical protein